jgi:PhzF family phenazine biosynthesis protein
VDLPIYQVAAFTEQMFGGNPAAVIPLDSWLDDSLMQKIAAENNLSETAFFVPVADDEWHIRWFTPTVEVPLCGHATLASAAVIQAKLGQSRWPITLRSASGPLRVDHDDGTFILDFPSNPPLLTGAPEGLEAALGTEFGDTFIARDLHMVTLPDEQSVAELTPDFAALAGLVEHGVIATAQGDQVDFVSRFFAPAIGINEDPVTGAAHCVLTPYWSRVLGKPKLIARQISSRVGYIACEDRGDRVLLSGRVRFFLDGVLACGDE